MSVINGDLSESSGPVHLDGNGAASAKAAARTAFLREAPTADALRALPADFVKRHRVLPLDIRAGSIRVATGEVGNSRVVDDIRLLTGLEVEEVLAPSDELVERIAELYQVTVEQIVENLAAGKG